MKKDTFKLQLSDKIGGDSSLSLPLKFREVKKVWVGGGDGGTSEELNAMGNDKWK